MENVGRREDVIVFSNSLAARWEGAILMSVRGGIFLWHITVGFFFFFFSGKGADFWTRFSRWEKRVGDGWDRLLYYV